jgi:hypothetical protein
MQPGDDERFACLDLAADPLTETPLCPQRDERGVRRLAVSLL